MSDGKYQERYDVVVVGGGFAGRIAARVAAEGGAKVLLVDSKEYFEFTPAACRCIVHPPSIHHCTSRHNSPPGLDMRVMHGTVRELRRNDVLVVFPEGKRRVRFRYCVWAGGCSYKSPIRPALDSESVDERRAELERNRIQLEQARRCVLLALAQTLIVDSTKSFVPIFRPLTAFSLLLIPGRHAKPWTKRLVLSCGSILRTAEYLSSEEAWSE